MKNRLTIIVALIFALFLVACGGAAPEPAPEPAEEVVEEEMAEETMEEEVAPSIAEIAVADGNFNTLVAALDAAGLVETLSGEGAFTVFAPTDDAFAALPEGTVEALLEDPEGALTTVLLYHVVDGVVMAETVVTLDAATTLQGEDVSINAEDGVVLNDSVNIVVTDIEASNGVIHVIDAVLLPPSMSAEDEMMDEEMMEEPTMSIAEIAVADGNFTTLVAALDAAGLVETMSGEGAFTVFAPTDDAFAALPEGTVEALLEDPEGALTDILLYHVVDGVVKAETVVTLESATTLNGADVSINAEDGVVLNDSVNVVVTDIMATNGVIHVIDAVLLPPADEMMEEEAMMEEPTMSIAEIAVADGSFTTLVAALDAAGLVDTFAGEGEFTVFAPTDDAFAALPEGTVEALLEDPSGALTDILLYHVVEGVVKAEDVVALESATTMLWKDISINAEDGVVLNDSVNVVVTDIMATNGVIHVIDAVLLPPAEEAMEEDAMMDDVELVSIAEIASTSEDFETLTAALTAAGLVDTLAGEGEFTVFAPTDDAFAALPEGTVESLLEDPEGALTDILLYHVAEGTVMSDVVVTLESATTLNGADVTISIDDDGNVVLNDSAKVVLVDVKASNGVIHVIDMVLLPPAE